MQMQLLCLSYCKYHKKCANLQKLYHTFGDLSRELCIYYVKILLIIESFFYYITNLCKIPIFRFARRFQKSFIFHFFKSAIVCGTTQSGIPHEVSQSFLPLPNRNVVKGVWTGEKTSKRCPITPIRIISFCFFLSLSVWQWQYRIRSPMSREVVLYKRRVQMESLSINSTDL